MSALGTFGGIVVIIGGAVGAISGGYTLATRSQFERTKADIERIAFEQQTRFSRLHDRRISVLADLYTKLVRAERAITVWVHPLELPGEPSAEEKPAAATKSANEFRDCFLENRIWLDEDLSRLIGEFDSLLGETHTKFGIVVRHGRALSGSIDKWMEAWKTISEKAPVARSGIETRFRELLGVSQPPSTGP